MNKAQAAHDILTHALPLVAFDGWTMRTLFKAAESAGYKRTDAIRVFPGGAIDAVDTFMQHWNEQMIAALAGYSLDTMKIRERIATCVRVKLELMDGHREAVRRALALYALPFYAHHGLKHVYATVDEMWHQTGDQSSDFNFYTKRLTLAAVYSATLTFWLNDDSMGHQASWDFLARRIENVMQFEKTKQQIKKWWAQLAG